MFRKHLQKATIVLLLTAFSLFNYCPLAFSALPNAMKGSCSATEKIVDYSVPPKLEARMKEAIAKIYGTDKVGVIYPKITEIITKTKQNRPLKLYLEDLNRSDDWYKDEIIYMFYVDQFGVVDKNSTNTFEDTVKMLDYLQDLGVTTLFMLPFIDSPMGDAGFDIRDPKNVRQDLGGIKEFNEFITEAKKRGFKIKSDLILNHFSDQHKWFQDALKGDISKIDYFVNADKVPPYKKYLDEQKGMVIDYKEKDGTVSQRRLIFPDICENHYRKVTINGKDHFFYHTFYPFQLDVNWENPEVLFYMLDVIGSWANVGVDIFRMDAIPYYIKQSGTNAENLPQTHEVIALLSSFVQTVAPCSVMQAEACQWPKDILPYFGEEKTTKHDIICNKENKVTRTDEVQIAYHFPYMPAIWASMLTEDNGHFWKAYAETPQIPDTATWAVFLRVHDELTLEMVDIATRKLIYGELADKGAEFRKGFGVSGRMANFLDNDPDRIGLAFSVLMSMPGIPIIYYGDEIGAQNNWKYARESEAMREDMAKKKGADKDVISFFDSRDINRGPVTGNAFYSAEKNPNEFSGKIYAKTKKLISLRKSNPVVNRGVFEKIETPNKEVFAYLRTYKNESMLIVNNLSNKSTVSKLNIPAKAVKKVKQKALTDLISNKQIQIKKNSQKLYELELKPYQSVWLKL